MKRRPAATFTSTPHLAGKDEMRSSTSHLRRGRFGGRQGPTGSHQHCRPDLTSVECHFRIRGQHDLVASGRRGVGDRDSGFVGLDHYQAGVVGIDEAVQSGVDVQGRIESHHM